LAVLQHQLVAGLERVVNGSEPRTIGGDIKGVRQFVDRIVGRIFCGYPYRQDHLDPLVSTLTDAFLQANPQMQMRQYLSALLECRT
jgi:hypothetical protein